MPVLLLPGPATPISHPRHSDYAGMVHRTGLAPRRSSDSDTLSWYRWSSADTGGMCYPTGKGLSSEHGNLCSDPVRPDTDTYIIMCTRHCLPPRIK